MTRIEPITLKVPVRATWRSWADRFMIVVAAGGSGWLIIQAYHIFSTHTADGVSLLAYILALAGGVIWLLYAMYALREVNRPLLVNGITTMLACTVIIIGIVLYGNGSVFRQMQLQAIKQTSAEQTEPGK